jgi:hypothetical protein
MKILLLAALALLMLSLAGLEVVTSAMSDEPITPAEIRAAATPAAGGALPLPRECLLVPGEPDTGF